MPKENSKDILMKLIGVIDKAITMERTAKDFYTAASYRVEAKEGAKMFEWLAAFEEGHERRLLSRRSEVMSHPLMEGSNMPFREDQSVVSEARSNQIRSSMSDADVLMIALGNERGAVEYYKAKAESAGDEESKTLLLRMASDEEKHIKILSEQLKSLETEKFWMDMAAFENMKGA